MAEKQDKSGAWLGILIFLIGIAMIVFTFYKAWELFSIAPSQNLGIMSGKDLNINNAANSAWGLVRSILGLLLMCWFGSVIANKGIRMYQHSRGIPERDLFPSGSIKKRKPEVVAEDED